MRRPKTEQGMALLTVLLLVAVMGAMSAIALESINRSMKLAGNSRANMQARYFAMAAEQAALHRIEALLAATPDRLTLAGGWNGRSFDIPAGDGVISARVTDGGNCFNLNSVGEGARPTALKARPAGAQQFVALMGVLGIPPAEAGAVAGGLTDWLDSDTSPLPGGGEDGTYARADVPYLAGNAMLAEPSELRAVAGVTPEIYDVIRPWVCALPTTELSPININTLLPSQAPLLAMMLPGQLGLDAARQVLQDRPAAGWSSVLDFWKHPTLGGLTPGNDQLEQPKLTTRFFNIEIKAEQGGYEAIETATLEMTRDRGRVIARRWTAAE